MSNNTREISTTPKITHSSFSNLVDWLNAQGVKDYIVNQPMTVEASKDVTGIRWHFSNTGKLVCASGAVLTGFQPAKAYSFQIVDCALADVPTIVGIEHVTPQMFYSSGDASWSDSINKAIASLPSGNVRGKVFLKGGSYSCLDTIDMYKRNVWLCGAGGLSAYLDFTGMAATKDGITCKNTGVNLYERVNVKLTDLGFGRDDSTVSGNAVTGAAIVFSKIAYFDVVNCYIQKFKYGVIVNACIHGSIKRNELAQQTFSCIWLTNGPDYDGASTKSLTNQLEIQMNQFNTPVADGTFHIVDDGGVNHSIKDNNFNGGGTQLRCANVQDADISCNEFEKTSGTDPIIHFAYATQKDNNHYFANQSINWDTNSVTSQTTQDYEIVIDSLVSSIIETCGFTARVAVASIGILGSDVYLNDIKLKTIAVSIKGSQPLFDATQFATYGKFFDLTALTAYTIGNQSFSGGGSRTVPVNSMLNIEKFSNLYVCNEDGSNGEVVRVTGVTASEFTAVFVSNKSGDLYVHELPNQLRIKEFTPVLEGGTTAGTWLSLGSAGYYWQEKNEIKFKGTLYGTLIGAAGDLRISGLAINPFSITNLSTMVPIGSWQGFTLTTGYTFLSGFISGSSPKINLRQSGSAKTANGVGAALITGDIFMTFEGSYLI